jgi:hypothetical protein
LMNPSPNSYGQDVITSGRTAAGSSGSNDWEWNYGIWSSEWLNSPI